MTLAVETAGPFSQFEPSSGGERILDADEVSAELVVDAPAPAPSSAPPIAAARRARSLVPPPPVHKRLPPTAATLSTRLEQAEAELTRVKRQMRARDAYLAELEQALQASTSKLEASGIGSVEDAHKLLGRVRGQAFRIAELESELRHMEQRLSRLARLLPAGYTA
jgi:septal ring factor EnvC (AmiA/AmiB activator)